MLDDREQEIKDLREKIDELLSSKDDIEKTAEKILSEIQLLEDEKQRF